MDLIEVVGDYNTKFTCSSDIMNMFSFHFYVLIKKDQGAC